MSTRPADRPQTSTLSGLSRSRLASTTALVAALTLALQPLLAGVARAQVIVDPTAPIEFRPGIGVSPRGAPVVDITAPSFGGLSHNKFERFDVDTSGVILNNSGLGGESILGGRIGANPNLVGRQPARTILNEVTGTDPSRLGGPTEVFGTRADVIVANPNGVGCVGCTFVNAGRVTLSTGTPVPDYVRGTVGFEVRRGTIEISGAGLSAPAGMQPLGDVDLVGRRIGLDGAIVAGDRVRLRAGAVTYDPGSDLATPLVGADALAGLAIAGTPAGTIRAGAISILSRDVDLGIVLAGDLAAQADSIVVSSFGDVALGGTRADLDTLVDARGDVLLAGTHEAGRLLAVQGTDVTLDGRVAAGQAIAVEARGTLDSAAEIASGGAIGLLGAEAARVSGEIRAGGALGIEGGDVETRDLSAGATRIGIAARGDVRLDRTRLASQSDISIGGRDVALGLGTAFGAPGRLDIGARRDFLNETVLEHPRLSLAIGRSFLNGATGFYLDDTIALTLTGDLVNAGLIQARLLARIAARDLVVGGDGAIDAPDLDIALSGAASNAGVLQGRDRLVLAADALLNAAPGRILGDAITLRVDGGLTNLGAILAPETLAIVAGGLVGNDGTLATGGALTLTGASYVAGSPAARLAGASVDLVLGGGLDNAGAILAEDALAILAASARVRAGASLRTLGDLDLTLAGDLVNEGAIDASGDVALEVGGGLANPGTLLAGGTLAARIDGGLVVGGTFAAIGDLDLLLGTDLVVGGLLASQGRADVDARALSIGADAILFGDRVDVALRSGAQVAGSLLARGDLLVDAAGAIAAAGTIRAGGDLVLVGASYLGASAAAELSGASATIALAGAFASHGRVVGEAGLAIAAGSLALHAGARASGGFVDLTIAHDASIAGTLEAHDLVLGEIGGALAIAGSMRATAPTGQIGLLVTGPVTLSGTLAAPGRVVLASAALTNAGGLLSGGDVALALSGALVNSGTILATGELSIGAGAVLSAGSSGAHAHLGGRILEIEAQGRVDAGAFSVTEGREGTRILARASNLDLFGEHGIAQGRFAFGQSLELALREQGLTVSAGRRIMAAGDLTLVFGGEISVLGTIAAGGDLALASTGGSIDIGGSTGGALLFTLSDAQIEAAGNLVVASSAIEALGRIDIAAGGAVMLRRTGGVTLQFSHRVVTVGGGGSVWHDDYYIEVETSPASMVLAGSDLTITASSLDNHVSTIAAGGVMAITVGVLTNRVRNLQRIHYQTKVSGPGSGFRGANPDGTWSVTPATIQAGGALVVAASQSLSNQGTMAGFSVGLSAPSISVGIVDPNVYTAPPALPDPVIDLSRFAVATPGFVVNATPVALVPGGARYLVTSPVPEAPRFDASGLPLPTREPTWILRQVGAVEGDLVFLADPITERRLIARALAEQTGRVLLNPEWRDPITQQEALYEGTVAFLLANPDISLGRELGAAERARVTAPMLWYVERAIDGQRVLVPQLILPAADLARYAYDPAGSVLSATDLMITGDRVRNAGSLVARENLVIDAGSFLNEQRLATARIGGHTRSAAQAGGNVLAGDLFIRTERDLVSRGGTLFGETGVTLVAGGDVRLEAQAAFNDILIRERRWSQHTVTLEHTATRVGSGGDLTIVAGGAFALVGSSLTAEGDVAVTARDGLTLSSVVDTIESTFTRRSRGFLRSSSSLDSFAAATHRGAAIGAGGNVTLLSGGDVLVVASDIAAGRDLLLAAGAGENGRADASVTILAGTDTRASLSERRSSGFGLFFGGGRLDFYRSSLNRDENATRTNAPSALIAGGDVTVLAPGDLTLAGSIVGAGGLATLSAGRDLLLLPGSEGAAQASLSRRTGFGFGFSASGGSASLSFGLARETIAAEAMRGTDVGASVAGVEGVLMEAGRDARLVAAQIRSAGDIDILAGRDLAILPGLDAERRSRREERSFAGITLSAGTNVVGAAQSLISSVDTFSSGYGNATYRAIGMASGIMQATDALRSLSDPQLSASLSIGFSQSRIAQSEQATGLVPTLLDAGRDLTLAAGRDLSLVATQASAARDMALIAGRDVIVESGQALFDAQSRSSSLAASIGIGVTLSPTREPTFGVTIEGSGSRARSDTRGSAQVNSNLLAGERLVVSSGQDVTIAGATLRARDVDLFVGRNLEITSRQDEGRTRGSSAHAGLSLTIGLYGGPSSLSIDAGAGRERADSARVFEQTAIVAERRLDAYVVGHTQLNGGLLAALSGDLTLDTATFGFADIEDRARSEAVRASVGLNFGLAAQSQPGIRAEGEIATTRMDGTTRATVGPGEILIRDEEAQTRDLAALNRDVDAAQEVFRNEAAGVRFYASDSALRELASGFAQTRANIEALSQADVGRLLDDIASVGDLIANALGLAGDRKDATAAEQQAAYDLMRDVIEGRVSVDVLAACGRQGSNRFHILDWLFPPAYAADPCAIYSQRVIDLCLDGFNILQTLLVENTADALQQLASAAQNDPQTLAKLVGLLSMTPAAIASAPFEEEIMRVLREEGIEPEVYVEAFVSRQINALLAGATTPEVAVGSSLAVLFVVAKAAPPATAARATQAAAAAFRRDQSAIQSAAQGFYDPLAWRRYYDDFYSGNVTSTTVPPFSAPNVRLAGQAHPVTGVVFDQRGFPIFDKDVVFDTRLPATSFQGSSYQSQMRMATRDLRAAIERAPELGSAFSPSQLQAIQAGNVRIPGLTWHHHQDAGRMQLVPTGVHRDTHHIGGGSMLGGR